MKHSTLTRNIIITSLLFVVVIATNKPNVIVIVADDVGWNDVGFHGSNQVPTPNIDALAYNGIILKNYYTLPICTPSRTSLVTGKHPTRLGMQHNVIWPSEPWGLSLDEKILPEYLKDNGYSTHLLGKWHLGQHKKDYLPTYRGFDTHLGFWNSHIDYYTHMRWHEFNVDYKGYDFRKNMEEADEYMNDYITTLITNETDRIISQHNTSNPLFLYIGHAAVHVANSFDPLQAPQETINLFNDIEDPNRRIYAAMLHELDKSIGSLITSLSNNGILDNTIIIFTTDNGGCPAGFTYSAGSNWPLRGVKESPWEGGVRAVGFIWSPLLTSHSYVSNQLMHIQDWLPTIMSAINSSDSLQGLDLDGIDFWSALNNPESPNLRNSLLINIDEIEQYYALRMGDWKLLSGQPREGWDEVYGPTGREGIYDIHKLIRSDVVKILTDSDIMLPPIDKILQLRNESQIYCEHLGLTTCNAFGGDECLFNLKDDPCEVYNVAKLYPEIVEEMKILLAIYNSSAIPSVRQEPDPASDPIYWNNFWNNWQDYPSPL